LPEGVRLYNLFPLLAGTVTEWEDHLDRIKAMGFNWIFLNPFHFPGFSGSLYAVKDYYSFNPLMIPDGQKDDNDKLISGFVKAAKKRGLLVMMDLVANHTGKDALLTEEHPEWFLREPDGSLSSPFAVDPGDPRKRTVWADLAELNYHDGPQQKPLVDFFCGVIRHYIKLGIRGFRCDAAYKIRADIWQRMIEAGQKANRNVVFVAENLGAMQEQVEAMRGAGFDYLFNSAKWWDFRQDWLLKQYELFRSIAPSISFPESHDTERLIEKLGADGVTATNEVKQSYRHAYLFSAAFATGVMITMGFEYGFSKRLHVVHTRPADWEKPAFDISGYIADVNRMKASVPALNEEGPQRAVMLDGGRVMALERRTESGPGWAVTLVNPDPEASVTARVDGLDRSISGGHEVTPGWQGVPLHPGMEITLDPGDVRVFANS
jgi:starch synthase (maltosyl-transferring)